MKQRTVFIAASMAAALAAPSQAADPLKVGFVYVSPVGSAGWTYQHDAARKKMEKAFGGKVKTTFVEKVPEGADAERVIRQLAASGHKIIFTTSFGYMDPTIKVAKRFPNVYFEHATGYKRSKNVATYLARFYEGRYLAGIIAGKMTKTNIIGHVAAFPIPEVIRGINAFTRGMRSVNPKAVAKVIWVNSWYDPGKERETADALIAQGADVITHHTDSSAAVQAAEAKGVFAIAYHSDMSKFGPKAHLTASTHQWGDYYIRRVKAVLEGKWTSTATWGGIKEGMVGLAPLSKQIPVDVRKMVMTALADIKSGKLHPFAGPVVNQAGKTIIPAGRNMTDKEMSEMSWYVQGVQGSLPKK